MTSSSREEFTQINIRPNGSWYNGDKLIINKDVLSYFKNNLNRDEKGIYVFNKFGEFSEKGYLQVHGPVVNIAEITDQNFILENGEDVPRDLAKLILDQSQVPFVYLESLQAWAGFTKAALTVFSDDIEDIDDVLYYKGKAIEVLPAIKWA